MKKKITLVELLSDRRFRKLSLQSLRRIIDEDISYNDYTQLPGMMSLDKASNLMEAWVVTADKNKKLMILENYIDWLTSDETERERMKAGAFQYVEEDHVNELL